MKHIVVIGGGVVGLCSAIELANAGFAVTIIDSNRSGFDGCSWGNGGMIVPSHFEPLAAPGMVGLGLKNLPNPSGPFGFRIPPTKALIDWSIRFIRSATAAHVDSCAPILKEHHLASRKLYVQFEEESGGTLGLQTKGLLALCADQKTLDAEAQVAHHAESLGLRAEVLSREQVAASDPGITMNVAGAVHFHDDAHLDPFRTMSFLMARANQLGVRHKHDLVKGFIREGAAISAAVTDAGNVPGDEFVIATGAWTAEVGGMLGLKMPMMAGKGYGFSIAHPPQMPEICSILTEARVAVTPMGDRLRFVGTMEIGEPNVDINWNRVHGIVESIGRYFPKFDGLEIGSREIPKENVWLGLRPVTPDGMPYLGRPRKLSNVIVAAGHGMMGMSLGPICGRLVRELLTDASPSVRLEGLHPDRFAS